MVNKDITLRIIRNMLPEINPFQLDCARATYYWLNSDGHSVKCGQLSRAER